MKPNTSIKTLWSELLPHEFKRRLEKCPIVYLPLGLCEPHGQISAFGLDTLKAEWLCVQAAERAGGIVAPSMGYHIHETGYHARWLEDEVGEANPWMTSIPPGLFLQLFLYQLRAFANAGFRGVIVVSGHSGGNQQDMRLVAERFTDRFPLKAWVCSDPELVEDMIPGDHAGKYEISQLLHIRPDLIDLSAIRYENIPGFGGRLALGGDYREASAELGRRIMETSVSRLCDIALSLQTQTAGQSSEPHHRIGYGEVDTIWQELSANSLDWLTSKPKQGQEAVSASSQWKPYEYYSGRP